MNPYRSSLQFPISTKAAHNTQPSSQLHDFAFNPRKKSNQIDQDQEPRSPHTLSGVNRLSVTDAGPSSQSKGKGSIIKDKLPVQIYRRSWRS